MDHDQCCLKELSQVSQIPEQYQYFFPTWEHFTVITSYYINKRSVLSLDMTQAHPFSLPQKTTSVVYY